MDMPSDAQRRLADDEVAWLTTVTDRGAPAPNPVWFVPDGDDVVVFAPPSSVKVHNIEQRPLVTLHFNSDAHGFDIVVIRGEASLTPSAKPSALDAYMGKYRAAITGPLQMSVDAFDETYNTRIRIRPTGVRLTGA